MNSKYSDPKPLIALPAPQKRRALPDLKPQYLYKYRAFNSRAIQSLFENRVWVPNPTSFNDPFDCAATMLTAFRCEVNVSASLKFAMNKFNVSIPVKVDVPLRKLVDTFNNSELDSYEECHRDDEAFDRISVVNQLDQIRNMGIYSLTDNINNNLLWSHYADEHRGFCIQFQYTSSAEGAECFVKVEYGDDPPDLYELNGCEFRAKAAKFKMKEWTYESEYRCVYKEGNRAVAPPFPVVGIVFGLRMPTVQRNMIKQLLNGKDLSFSEMRLPDSGSPNELSVVKLHDTQK
jgi:hypothetical protein